MDAAQVNELVGLLDKYSPETLTALRRKHPQFSELLKPGKLCGDSDGQHSLQTFLAEVALDGMKEGIKLCDSALPVLKKRLLIASKVKFTAQIIAVIGGASIFTLLAQSQEYAVYAKFISAGLVLVGTVLPLVAQYVEGGLFQGGEAIKQLYEDLVECKLEATQILPQIEYCLKSKLTEPIAEQVSKANGLSVRIRKGIQKTMPANVTV
ncbi:MAG: hypothetical protein QOK48_854 [Blastocatellia bacterium]|jgi:hypothetical protein|nr:hypothetical protein [Blastocatellia bacterium]